jgi:hypothetical protein
LCLFWTKDGHFLHLSGPPALFHKSLAATPSVIIYSVKMLKSLPNTFVLYTVFMMEMTCWCASFPEEETQLPHIHLKWNRSFNHSLTNQLVN